MYVEEMENDYADLDEEVLNVLLGLADNLSLDYHVFSHCNKKCVVVLVLFVRFENAEFWFTVLVLTRRVRVND
jgi:hypothetical protein